MMKNKRKQFGDTKHFCPVAYKENYVLWPGNPEIGAKYREKVYYFSSTEARDKFISEPTLYAAKGNPFKVRTPVEKGVGGFLGYKIIILEIFKKKNLWQPLGVDYQNSKLSQQLSRHYELPTSQVVIWAQFHKACKHKILAKHRKVLLKVETT